MIKISCARCWDWNAAKLTCASVRSSSPTVRRSIVSKVLLDIFLKLFNAVQIRKKYRADTLTQVQSVLIAENFLIAVSFGDEHLKVTASPLLGG
jgi:hypothetical protein